MRTSPDSLSENAFDLVEGSYLLVHWHNGGPYLRRIWDEQNIEELFVLLPDLKAKQDNGFALFPGEKLDSNDPLYDVKNRLKGLL